MAADNKTIARVKKLLALAAPTSGATLGERESAAVEAAKLIAVHGIVIGGETKTETRIVYRDRPSAQPARRREPPPPGPTRMHTPFGAEYHVQYHPMPSRDWRRGTAVRRATCSDSSCNGSISPGDRVWERETAGQIEYLHADGPCSW